MLRRLLFLMAPEGDPPGGTAPPPPAGDGGTQPPGDQPPTQVTTKTGTILPMSQTTIDKLKREAQEKGKRAAASEFELKAKALGYSSVDEMMKAAERAKKNPPAPQRPSGGQQQRKPGNGAGSQPAGGPGNAKRLERLQRETQEKYDREKRERIKAQHKAEQAERDAWAAEAHGQLSRIAIKAGIKDEDYAITLLTREMAQKQATMSEADYEKYSKEFDETKYFEGLKKTHAHLFQETVVPATTGTQANGDAPPPPGAGAVADAQAKGARKDAKKMTDDEYRAEIRRRGLTPPGAG